MKNDIYIYNICGVGIENSYKSMYRDNGGIQRHFCMECMELYEYHVICTGFKIWYSTGYREMLKNIVS